MITFKYGAKNSIYSPFPHSLMIPFPVQSKQPGGAFAAGLLFIVNRL
ncbi:hypothetical protein HMPREF3293_01176 [Christensenella minuta]|uniref:Uncharacterized protein n=1 Tax=Christensenella minuta TaxID=626937 RepID=A0A136Q5L7_9FIRM|nr:hypothetical protein HMPREF3293_01176 [Christensenella minuta]